MSEASFPAPAAPLVQSADLLLDRCPRLVRVTGHAVYVAPEFAGNCFYVDGGYWLLSAAGVWRHSANFDGPWQCIGPEQVAAALLRLPRSAYHALPARLGEGEPYRPPRWDLLWGAGWALRHAGWARRVGHDPPKPRPPTQQAQELQRNPARRLPLPTDFSRTEEHT